MQIMAVGYVARTWCAGEVSINTQCSEQGCMFHPSYHTIPPFSLIIITIAMLFASTIEGKFYNEDMFKETTLQGAPATCFGVVVLFR